MSKKSKKASQSNDDKSSAWLSMRTGIILMGIISAGLVAWVTFQADPSLPLGERILWGLGFAASLWIVFAIFYMINRYVFKR